MDSGILNVAKPIGSSSFGVVRNIGRLPGIKKVGHGGTLDPAADGVLPVLVNAATRLAEFVHAWRKTYVARAVFGFTSDTYDREGVITAQGDPEMVTADSIRQQLAAFTGTISQVPPIFSALKREGEALYRKARRGENVVLEAREVHVEEIRLLDYERETAIARLEIICGQGMYVRSLVHDLGQRLGCGAYLGALRRTAYGPLRWDEAITPVELQELNGTWASRLLPMELPLEDWPALRLTREDAESVCQGRGVSVGSASSGRYRLHDEAGTFLGWGIADSGRLQPKAILRR